MVIDYGSVADAEPRTNQRWWQQYATEWRYRLGPDSTNDGYAGAQRTQDLEDVNTNVGHNPLNISDEKKAEDKDNGKKKSKGVSLYRWPPAGKIAPSTKEQRGHELLFE
jgi:hypothetical protein